MKPSDLKRYTFSDISIFAKSHQVFFSTKFTFVLWSPSSMCQCSIVQLLWGLHCFLICIVDYFCSASTILVGPPSCQTLSLVADIRNLLYGPFARNMCTINILVRPFLLIFTMSYHITLGIVLHSYQLLAMPFVYLVCYWQHSYNSSQVAWFTWIIYIFLCSPGMRLVFTKSSTEHYVRSFARDTNRNVQEHIFNCYPHPNFAVLG